jgi:hypothetical protein
VLWQVDVGIDRSESRSELIRSQLASADSLTAEEYITHTRSEARPAVTVPET